MKSKTFNSEKLKALLDGIVKGDIEGETTTGFAARLGISFSALQHYRAGRREPPLSVVFKIAEATKSKVEDWVK